MGSGNLEGPPVGVGSCTLGREREREREGEREGRRERERETERQRDRETKREKYKIKTETVYQNESKRVHQTKRSLAPNQKQNKTTIKQKRV